MKERRDGKEGVVKPNWRLVYLENSAPAPVVSTPGSVLGSLRWIERTALHMLDRHSPPTVSFQGADLQSRLNRRCCGEVAEGSF